MSDARRLNPAGSIPVVLCFFSVPITNIGAIRGSQVLLQKFRVTPRRILRTTSVKEETNQQKP